MSASAGCHGSSLPWGFLWVLATQTHDLNQQADQTIGPPLALMCTLHHLGDRGQADFLP